MLLFLNVFELPTASQIPVTLESLAWSALKLLDLWEEVLFSRLARGLPPGALHPEESGEASYTT